MSEPSNIDEANEKIARALTINANYGKGKTVRESLSIADKIKRSLEALARLNLAYLREHPECPKLYESNVVFDPIVVNRLEMHGTVPTLLDSGRATVSELVAWRIAELALEGRPATVRVVWHTRFGFSPLVRRQDGTSENPAAIILGKHP